MSFGCCLRPIVRGMHDASLERDERTGTAGGGFPQWLGELGRHDV